MSIRLLLTGFSLGSGLAFAQSPAKTGTIREARADEVVPVAPIPGDTAPVARAVAPDDTGYEQYRANNPQLQPQGPAGNPYQYPNPNQNPNGNAQQNDSTMVGRAWTNVKKWVNDRGTNFSKSFSDNGGSGDPGLMPLSPAVMPQFANGQNGQGGPVGQAGQYPPNGQYGQMNRQPMGQNPNANQNPYQFNTQQQPQPQPFARSPQAPTPYGGGPVIAGPQGAGPPPTQLAGRPAYNWYGYGSAPPSGFPQASTNWMHQTGATPGAFPVTGQPVIPRPAYIPGPRAVSTIPTIPSPVIPPPSMSQVSAESTPPGNLALSNPGAASGDLKAIPTVTPPPVSNSAPMAPYSNTPATPAASPRFEEPEWQPATVSSSQRTEQSGVTTVSGQVVHASGVSENDNEPSWQTAKIPTPRLIPVPKQEAVSPTERERMPAELPMPIPHVNMEIPVQAQIPVVDVTPKFQPIPTAVATQVATQPVPQTQPPVPQFQPVPQPTQPVPQFQPVTTSQAPVATPQVPAATATNNTPATMTAMAPATTVTPVQSAPWPPVAAPISRPTANNTQSYANANMNTPSPAAQTTWSQTPQQFQPQSTTGRVVNRNQPQQQAPRAAQTNANVNSLSAGGMAPPPPDAPMPKLIPVNASREILDIERQIRAASVRSATILEVNEAGPRKLVVKFVSKTEEAAREAAQSISQLPVLKPYAVDFEVRLANR